MTEFTRIAATVAVAAGLALVPAAAMASAGSAAGLPAPPGVTAAGPIQYAPQLHVPRTHLPVRTSPSAETALPGTFASGNWAGYIDIADPGKTFTYVNTHFRIPTLSATQLSQCVANAIEDPSGVSYAYYWVGLDGWTDNTVEQVGAATYCDSNGSTGTFAWYEMYPANPVTFTGTHPGDEIAVTVSYAGGKYDMAFADSTSGGHFSSVQPCAAASTCDRSSAEVLTEDPGGGPPVYLAPYGSMSYTSVSAKASGVTGNLGSSSAWSGSNRIEEEYGAIMQAPAALVSTGTGFSITWQYPF
jgi:hypothetical protein